MNKAVLASFAGAVVCLMAGQPVGVVFCLILAWVARSGSDAINAATTHEENNSALIFWSLVVAVVLFFMMAYAGAVTMVDPDAKFVTDDALLRALLED